MSAKVGFEFTIDAVEEGLNEENYDSTVKIECQMLGNDYDNTRTVGFKNTKGDRQTFIDFYNLAYKDFIKNFNDTEI